MQRQAIPVRKPAFDFDSDVPRYYLDDSPVKSHFFNGLNLLFPDGERFFVKSVVDHIAQIKDPQLLADVKGFCGQEGQHANQHQRFFAVLERQGYTVAPFLEHFRKVAQFANRWLPRGLRLSMTAGAEHYTATMAELGLGTNMLDGCDPVMRQLITWHAVEEVEHKHVAYDVLMAVHPHNYPLRILGFALATASIVTGSMLGMRMFFQQDGRAHRITKAEYLKSRAALGNKRESGFRGALRKQLLTYLKPGFHPGYADDQQLAAQYLPDGMYTN